MHYGILSSAGFLPPAQPASRPRTRTRARTILNHFFISFPPKKFFHCLTGYPPGKIIYGISSMRPLYVISTRKSLSRSNIICPNQLFAFNSALESLAEIVIFPKQQPSAKIEIVKLHDVFATFWAICRKRSSLSSHYRGVFPNPI